MRREIPEEAMKYIVELYERHREDATKMDMAEQRARGSSTTYRAEINEDILKLEYEGQVPVPPELPVDLHEFLDVYDVTDLEDLQEYLEEHNLTIYKRDSEDL